jgi:hypothetical protein
VALARVAQLIWRSISDTDCLIRRAVASAFGLRLCQQFGCLPVGEPRLEAAIHGKHEHDHFDKGGNVFAEEASRRNQSSRCCLLLHSQFSKFGGKSWTERDSRKVFHPNAFRERGAQVDLQPSLVQGPWPGKPPSWLVCKEDANVLDQNRTIAAKQPIGSMLAPAADIGRDLADVNAAPIGACRP